MPLSTIHFCESIQPALAKWLAAQAYSRVCVLCDTHTEALCVPLLPEAAAKHVIVVPFGESHKNITTVQHIWQQLLAINADRHTLLLNVGGGVVGDMGGFAAATYKRGIDFVQVPTTLLAMIDASVGGKLGIDFGNVKNSVGVFAPPKAVFICPQFLQTLPDRVLRSGFAEMLKHQLIAQPTLDTAQIVPQMAAIRASVTIKARIVAQDPLEQGLRKILNFGHTIGHALESLFLQTDAPLLHGEAVAIGMICEAHISSQKLGFETAKLVNLVAAISQWFVLPQIPLAQSEVLWQLMQNDKKNNDNAVKAVLLADIGQPKWDFAITQHDLRESLVFYNTTAPICLPLPTSKSIANRYLILQALLGNHLLTLQNLSTADDTRILQNLLTAPPQKNLLNASSQNYLDCGAGGTTLRFLLAYKALTTPQTVTIGGSARLHERPIAILVNALRELGANIQYVDKQGFAPVTIAPAALHSRAITVAGNVSSQFLSALLLIAPFLPDGLTLHLSGELVSRPYLQLTQRCLAQIGAEVTEMPDQIVVQPLRKRTAQTLRIPADWSSASYIYVAAILGAQPAIFIPNLQFDDGQSDQFMAHFAAHFGIVSTPFPTGMLLRKAHTTNDLTHLHHTTISLADCPDIAQTIAVLCAACAIPITLTGLQTLRIKETDRIAALQTELLKIGTQTTATADTLTIGESRLSPTLSVAIDTYHDHRMAMAFAPLQLIIKALRINEAEVVSKSFPDFWATMALLGIENGV